MKTNLPEIFGKYRSMKNEGSFTACKGCSGHICCGKIKEGGPIEPPFLTTNDIKEIEYYSGLKKEQFSTKRINPVTKNIINIMQTNDNAGCIFLNKTDGKCKIHSFRPLDCRLYPLDIEFLDNKYYWALFNTKKCKLTDDDLHTHLDFADSVLEFLGNELHDYATLPVPGMSEIGYRIIRQIC